MCEVVYLFHRWILAFNTLINQTTIKIYKTEPNFVQFLQFVYGLTKGFNYKTTILLTSCLVMIVKQWQNIANISQHILLYKYQSLCVSQKFEIYCQLNITQHDALHQNKHSVHYCFPLHIHSSFFTVSVLTLQSSICVHMHLSLLVFFQWLTDLLSYTYKVLLLQFQSQNICNHG